MTDRYYLSVKVIIEQIFVLQGLALLVNCLSCSKHISVIFNTSAFFNNNVWYVTFLRFYQFADVLILKYMVLAADGIDIPPDSSLCLAHSFAELQVQLTF